MKKVNICFIILIFIHLISCKIDNVENGRIYSEYNTTNSNREKSIVHSKSQIYKKLAKSISSEIGRDDIDIIASEIENKNIIDFFDTNKVNIKTRKSGKNYITEIDINDKTLYSNAVNILSSLKQEGQISSNTFRAKGVTKLEAGLELSPFVRSSIERSTLNKARENLYDIMIKNSVNANIANNATNSAYIIEETYSKTEYTVVIENDI